MTFFKWLKEQTRRSDMVGDVARDAVADPHHKGNMLRWWMEHITTEHDACAGAIDALETAWREYQRYQYGPFARTGVPRIRGAK